MALQEHWINDWGDAYALFDHNTIYLQKFDGIKPIDDGTGNLFPCLTVYYSNGIIGYMPPTELGIEMPTEQDINRMIKMKVPVQVKSIHRDDNIVILSRGIAADRLARRFWKAVEEGVIGTGSVVEGTIISPAIPHKDMTIEVMGVNGHVPGKEVFRDGWIYAKELQARYPIYADVKAAVLEIDAVEQKLVLSLKALQPDPWLNGVKEKYAIGTVHNGLIVSKTQNGSISRFRDGLVCFCGAADKANIGEEILVKIRKISINNQKMAGVMISR